MTTGYNRFVIYSSPVRLSLLSNFSIIDSLNEEFPNHFHTQIGQKPMNTAQLLAFDRIVREGSFSRAAQWLDISQPTISARIRNLEKEIGGELFTRGGRYMALTQLGESFLPYARRALTILQEGKEAAQLAEQGQRGRLTIGTIESLTGGFLATAVTRFHRDHPHVEIFIRAEHTAQIVPMLQDGIIKLGLITWPFFGTDLVPLLRFREPLVLVVSPRHKLARKGTVTLAEVVEHAKPLLQVRWGPLGRPLLAQLNELSNEKIEVPIDTARQMVLNGIGAAFLTETLISEDLKMGRLVNLSVSDLAPVFRESALVRLRRHELSRVAERFVKVLREEARDRVTG